MKRVIVRLGLVTRNRSDFDRIQQLHLDSITWDGSSTAVRDSIGSQAKHRCS